MNDLEYDPQLVKDEMAKAMETANKRIKALRSKSNTVKGEGPTPLRGGPPRERLTEPEMRQLRLHVQRHPNRSVSWLANLCWVTEALIEEVRAS